MPDAYTNLLVHVVFSTKKRERRLTADVRKQLYPYLVALAKECRAEAHAVNGGLEHVHLMVRITPSSSISDLVKFLKANSSRWIRTKFDREFQWQIGYAALSVSRSSFAQVCTYIDRQEDHHRRISFEDEFMSLLKRNEIEFDQERLLG